MEFLTKKYYKKHVLLINLFEIGLEYNEKNTTNDSSVCSVSNGFSKNKFNGWCLYSKSNVDKH